VATGVTGGGVVLGFTTGGVPCSILTVKKYCELRGLRFLSVRVILIVYIVLVAEVLVGLKVKQRRDLLVKVVVSFISTATTIASLSGSE